LASLAFAGAGGEEIQSALKSKLEKYDLNNDAALSLEEFTQIFPPDQESIALSVFHQADVNDDDQLNLKEVTFAHYIANEHSINQRLNRLAAAMPIGFREGIDGAFQRVRMNADGGAVLPQVILQELSNLPTIDSVVFNKDVVPALAPVLELADIIEDGVLNLNELDFLQFMTRELLADSAFRAEKGSQAMAAKLQLADDMWEKFYQKMDANGDGCLDRREVVNGFWAHASVAGSPSLLFKSRVHDLFATADRSNDEVLDRLEVFELTSWLLL